MKKLLYFILLVCIFFVGCNQQQVDYKLTLQDESGNIIDQYTFNKDTIIDLDKYNTESYYYVWDMNQNEIISSLKDVVVRGTIVKYTKKHIFIINEEVVFEYSGSMSDEPVKPNPPVGTDTFEWVVDEKLEEGVYVYTYTLNYKLKEFTVKFVDEEGNVLKEEQVEYGKSATAPETLEDVKWDKDFEEITGDLIVTGSYKKSECKIEFYDDKTLLDLGMNSYKVGERTELPKPTKEGYEFVGWFASSISLYRFTYLDENTYGDLKLYARFIATEVKELFVLPESTYKLTGIASIPHSSGNGTYVFQPILPSEANQSKGAYAWSSSDTSIATISAYSSITAKKAGFCVITGTLISDPNVTVNGVIKVTSEGVIFSNADEANTIELCTVTFVGKNDEVIDIQTVLKGGAAYYPTPLEYEGLKFVGWDRDNYNILEDTTIKAKYEEGTNKYVGKKFALIGDSISTYQDCIPDGYACFYPYPTADVNDVNQTWWMQAVNKLGAGMFINNSYSGSCVGTTGTSSSQHDVRLKELVINGQTPDVIIIFMGSNDCASQYVTDAAFKNAYRVMLNKIKVLCPDAEIVLCTLPKSNLYTEENRVTYNEIIEDYAKEYDLKLINLKHVDITGHLVDSAHPKKSGMTVVANRVIKDLLK